LLILNLDLDPDPELDPDPHSYPDSHSSKRLDPNQDPQINECGSETLRFRACPTKKFPEETWSKIYLGQDSDPEPDPDPGVFKSRK
jgi:hypothetical protein